MFFKKIKEINNRIVEIEKSISYIKQTITNLSIENCAFKTLLSIPDNKKEVENQISKWKEQMNDLVKNFTESDRYWYRDAYTNKLKEVSLILDILEQKYKKITQKEQFNAKKY